MWKKIAMEAKPRIEEAERRQFEAETKASHYKGRLDQVQALANEAIDLMRLLINATDVQVAPGIYFLLDKYGRVQYVGKSSNVLFRMAGHKAKAFAAVRMIHVKDPDERDRLERRFIHLLTPPINVAMTTYNDSQKLLVTTSEELAQKFQHTLTGDSEDA